MSDNIEINNNQDINKFPQAKIKKEQIPKMNIKKLSNLSDSIINYFVISICLILHSAFNLNWFNLKENSKFCFTYFIFAAVILYIIGIMNWYEGKELLFLFDFIFSFYFLTLYFNENYKTFFTPDFDDGSDKNDGKNSTNMNSNISTNIDISSTIFSNISDSIITDEKNEENLLDNNNNKLRAIFYIFIFCFFLVLLISSYRKGKIFMVNYFILFVGFVFLFLDNFFEDKYDCIKKTHYYIFIISGGLMWIIGILKLINNGFLSKEETILLGKTD